MFPATDAAAAALGIEKYDATVVKNASVEKNDRGFRCYVKTPAQEEQNVAFVKRAAERLAASVGGLVGARYQEYPCGHVGAGGDWSR